MREIKFRQPIFIKGKFKSFHYWGFISNGIFVGPEIHYMTIQEAREQSQQYINLKDKNGKEIYEGDVVKNHWYDCNGKFIGKIWSVKYGKHSVQGLDYYSNLGEGFYFDAISEKETYNIPNIPFDKDKGIEIIGNIYENPELLEERK